MSLYSGLVMRFDCMVHHGNYRLLASHASNEIVHPYQLSCSAKSQGFRSSIHPCKTNLKRFRVGPPNHMFKKFFDYDADAKPIEVTDKDLISDESMWTLYERWINNYQITRDMAEKHRRFNVFKRIAKFIHIENQIEKNFTMALTQFADTESRYPRLRVELMEEKLDSDESLWFLYKWWMSIYGIPRDEIERHWRFNVFKANVRHIVKVNKMRKPYKLGLNGFADMTNDEFRKFYSSNIMHQRMVHGSRAKTEFMYEKADNLPLSVDWRCCGAVTYIKNQYNCNSGWAFSTVVGVEGINQIKTGCLVSLAEQELIDCDTDNQCCNGGLMDSAYEFIKNRGGIMTESTYPYRAQNGLCDSAKIMVKIDGYENVPENNEDALMKAVANQPVSVAIDASGTDMQFYSTGVFTGKCGTNLDHGVAIVGYGTDGDGTKYWIVKNSWGIEWGEGGYIRMQREIGAPEGLCGIAMEASYPVKLSGDNPM